MTDEDFSKLVAEGMDAIPDEFAEHIDNVVVVFADEPSEQQRQELHLRDNTVLFGLYEGIPKTSRQSYNMALPDKITIFKNEIIRVVGTDKEAIRKQVTKTVWHEIAHHFGLSDAEIHRLEIT
ncbi:metallopeptidase family protein [Candidatus Saccharibacteria bacterium]|jgi:predicted Zn-dependent protease with MMP-like domain|nr:metallopeptidase family protein [Candidatus Saccharibacteria bacterium]MBP7018244.1 metallopeptidase family protein [Candidatus Saccharibacteria bacterium]